MKMNQKTALLLAILLVIGSAWGKARLTFCSMQKQLDVIYTEGIDRDGQSIAQDVKEKQKTAQNCVTVARRYDSAIKGFPDQRRGKRCRRVGSDRVDERVSAVGEKTRHGVYGADPRAFTSAAYGEG